MLAPNLATLRALIFDLDGTLIDSKEDLVLSVNAMLAEMGRERLPGNTISSYIGQGAPALVRRALEAGPPSATGEAPCGDAAEAHAKHDGKGLRSESLSRKAVDEEEAQRGLEFFLRYYEAHRMQHTRAYPGVKEALGALSGYPMAVLTNKPERISKRILEELDLACFFRAIYGGTVLSKLGFERWR
jgi:phosphoglycolate phosphatase